MRLRMLFLTTMLSASLVTGCATVNLSEMATPAAAKAETVPEKNIVLRAASKLYNMLTNKGFGAKDSGQRVQSAASVLLNGLEERDLTVADIDYAEQDLAITVVESDIRYATQHISQTNKAAEVFRLKWPHVGPQKAPKLRLSPEGLFWWVNNWAVII